MLTFIVVVAALAAGYAYLKFRTKAVASGTPSGVSAFAKVAELEGKLIALRVTAEAKKAEATAVHAALDEVHALLG